MMERCATRCCLRIEYKLLSYFWDARFGKIEVKKKEDLRSKCQKKTAIEEAEMVVRFVV
jgi:hypothetical protein